MFFLVKRWDLEFFSRWVEKSYFFSRLFEIYSVERDISYAKHSIFCRKVLKDCVEELVSVGELGQVEHD